MGQLEDHHSDAWARFRIKMTYLWRHHRLPDLLDPRTFTELVQRRKLIDRDPRMPPLADKVAVKQFVADRVGKEWVIPTLWTGEELPRQPRWPRPFVVKSRHGCKQNRFVLTGLEDWDRIRHDAAVWMRKTYGFWLDEWVYEEIPHGLLVEPFVGASGTVPVDYKFYVFNGRVGFIQVHLGRGGQHRWILFDPSWRRVSARTIDPDPAAPQSLPAMMEAAETLGKGFDFVRVDLYEPAGSPLFGEITFYPGSGLDPFNPVGLDAVIGAEWVRAIKEMKDQTNRSARVSSEAAEAECRERQEKPGIGAV